jgi:hypothetical protein
MRRRICLESEWFWGGVLECSSALAGACCLIQSNTPRYSFPLYQRTASNSAGSIRERTLHPHFSASSELPRDGDFPIDYANTKINSKGAPQAAKKPKLCTELQDLLAYFTKPVKLPLCHYGLEETEKPRNDH